MAERTFKLRKLFPPFGTAESPLWEFGYDEEVRVVGGLCEVGSPDLRDRLLKMGYELAAEGESGPDQSDEKDDEKGTATPPVSSPPPAEPKQGEAPPAQPPAQPAPRGSVDPAAAPEEQPGPQSGEPSQGGAAG